METDCVRERESRGVCTCASSKDTPRVSKDPTNGLNRDGKLLFAVYHGL